MDTNINGANGTSVEEIRAWFEKNKKNVENFANAQASIYNLRDVTKTTARRISAINKEDLKNYISNIASNEKSLRNVARYLYYRSNIFFRLVQWYTGMWDLTCRKVTPHIDLSGKNDETKMLKSYNNTLDVLDRFNLKSVMPEALANVYVQDVYYAIRYTDKTGTFFYPLDADECVIDSRYSTMDYGFSVDMSKWKSAQRQQIIEFLGSPLKEMYQEYERTGQRFIHCTDKYAVCFKFRTDTWDTVVPPLLSIYLSLASLEDLVDIQAEADALSIYKLIYMPMKVHANSKDVDDFQINPTVSKKYFDKLINDAIPDNVGAAMVPGDELKTIDFAKTVDSDVNSVEKSQNQILSTSGGGAVINSNNITSTAAFKAWLQSETEFAMATLMPQINGACNRWLSYEISNPCHVDHFKVSVYTKEYLAASLLESCKYSFSNRLAYNTLLGVSEKETMAMEMLETKILGLTSMMNHPLNSSFTQSGEVGEGAPTKDDTEISGSGERSRNE